MYVVLASVLIAILLVLVYLLVLHPKDIPYGPTQNNLTLHPKDRIGNNLSNFIFENLGIPADRTIMPSERWRRAETHLPIPRPPVTGFPERIEHYGRNSFLVYPNTEFVNKDAGVVATTHGSTLELLRRCASGDERCRAFSTDGTLYSTGTGETRRSCDDLYVRA